MNTKNSSRREFMRKALVLGLGATGVIKGTGCDRSSSSSGSGAPTKPLFQVYDMRINGNGTAQDANETLMTGQRHSAKVLFKPTNTYNNAKLRQVVYDKDGNLDSITTSDPIASMPAGDYAGTPVWQFPYHLREAGDNGRLEFELIEENGKRNTIAGFDLTPQLATKLSDNLHFAGELGELLEYKFKGYKNGQNTNPGLVVVRGDSVSQEESDAALNLQNAYIARMDSIVSGATVGMKKLSEVSGEKYRAHIGTPNSNSEILTVLNETGIQIPTGAGLIMTYARRPDYGFIAAGELGAEAELAAKGLEKVIQDPLSHTATKYKVTGTLANPVLEAL